MNAKKLWGKKGLAASLMILVLTSWAVPALAQDGGELEGTLEKMGGAYAQGYLAPLISGFGINQNSALYHTAHIPNTTISITVGLKVMATKLTDNDKDFSVVESITLDEDVGLNPGDIGYGEDGQIVMSGPTVFGDEDASGYMRAYFHGIQVYEEELPDLGGFIDTDYVPLAMPQATLGGIMGLEGTLRWLPEMTFSDMKVNLMGIGVAASANYWIPALPVDVKVGYFKQSLDVGDYIETDAKSLYIAASKAFTMLTVYGGLANESSSMDVSYTSDDSEDVNFSLDGVQENRMTIGATLNLGLKINAEIGMGDLTTYAGGAMFGF